MPNKNEHFIELSDWYINLQAIASKLNAVTKVHHISFEQFIILKQLNREGPSTPSKLASYFKTSMPAVTRKLNVLQSKALIRKLRGQPDDQRVVVIEITDEGVEVCKELEQDFKKWQNQHSLEAEIELLGKH